MVDSKDIPICMRSVPVCCCRANMSVGSVPRPQSAHRSAAPHVILSEPGFGKHGAAFMRAAYEKRHVVALHVSSGKHLKAMTHELHFWLARTYGARSSRRIRNVSVRAFGVHAILDAMTCQLLGWE